MLQKLLRLLPNTTIKVNAKPYLTRYYPLLKDWRLFNVYIHEFHSSDQGDELHSHPWSWAISFVYSGGYWEEYRTEDFKVKRRLVKPLAVNFITSNDFHRVDLLNEKSRSIFITGPRTKEWGFWNRHTGEFRHWSTNPDAIP